jgi:hypothetical protein
MPRHVRSSVAALLALLALACGEQSTSFDPDPQFNKGGAKGGGGSGDPTVTAVDPSHGRQGETIANVRISGSNFVSGAEAEWWRNGAPDLRIAVLATRFISSTQLEADIAIAADAELSLYDVAVKLPGGKRGVGIESFEVTTAVQLTGICAEVARGVNDSGDVVGAGCQSGFYWNDGTWANLGTGIATDIDEAGSTISGASWSSATKVQQGPALIWTGSGATWTRHELPSNGMTARANAIASDASGVAVLIAGQYQEVVNKRTTILRPTLWVRTGTQWQLRPLPAPAGVASTTSLRAHDVNANRQVAGGVAGTPVVWETAPDGSYTGTVLPGGGSAHGIAVDGNIVVGSAGGRAAYWRRTDGMWVGPHHLEPANGSCETWANAISANGLIVGKGCGSAVAWRVDQNGGVSRIALGGLGRQDASQEAWAVSASRLVGNALGTAVYWNAYF